MVDRIAIQGIRVFAHHGVLASERELGQPFEIDLTLHVDLRAAGRSDRLADTVDYGLVAQRVAHAAASGPFDLIEAVAERVANASLEDAAVLAVDVVVRKPRAPLPVVADHVRVEIHRERGAS